MPNFLCFVFEFAFLVNNWTVEVMMKKVEEKNEKKENLNLKKTVGIGFMVALFCGVMSLAIALNVSGGNIENKTEPVSTKEIEFKNPMLNAVVIKDFADDHLQYNASLNRWEIHLAVDMSSENADVFACCDGNVLSIDSNSLEGYVLKVSHDDGFVSVYSSLSEIEGLNVGDNVKVGQKIGKADSTAATESKEGGHLHFAMLKDGVEVDPNTYLDLQNK